MKDVGALLKQYGKFLAGGCLVILAAGCVLYGVKNGGVSGETGAVAEAEEEAAERPAESTRQEEPTATATVILSDEGITVEGGGVSAEDGRITITAAGVYEVSGSLSEGQIRVKAGGNDEVVLLLAGMEISNSSDAAVYVENAGNTLLYLRDGTENVITSGEKTDLETGAEEGAEADASGAAVRAKDDLTIAGGGSLSVCGYINNGIQTSNNLVIDSGTITVTAANHGIKGKDSVTAAGGAITVTSGGDGIQSDAEDGEGYGTVLISGGSLTIDSQEDGIQAETLLVVTDGSITAVCGDDAIHSNGDLEISGGTFDISCEDDAFHADDALTVSGGSLTAARCYEGIEANMILISGGEISIVASDDAVNAYGGQNQMGGGFGREAKKTDTMPEVRITGGSIYLNAGGDGIDSNGDLLVEGGTLVIDGPLSGGDGALDYGMENGGSCTISGGTVLAVGASGMAETFGSASTQYSFFYNLTASCEAGTQVAVYSEDGGLLFSHTAAKAFSSVVFSCPELSQDETFTLALGEESYDIVLTSVATSFGGRGQGGFGGGGGGMGGGRPGGGGGMGRGGFPGGGQNAGGAGAESDTDSGADAGDAEELPGGFGGGMGGRGSGGMGGMGGGPGGMNQGPQGF